MIAEKILGQKTVSLAKAKELVKERVKGSEGPTYEQEMTLKYTEKFVQLTRAKAEKLAAELLEIEGVDEWLATKLVDVLPQEKTVLDLMLAKKYTLSEEAMQRVLDTVKKFVK